MPIQVKELRGHLSKVSRRVLDDNFPATLIDSKTVFVVSWYPLDF